MKLADGMEFNTNSWMTGVRKELGDEFDKENKFSGNYPITGFSVVKEDNNEVLGFIEDFDEKDLDSNLSKFVDPILKEANVNLEDVNIVLHFGRTTDSERTRLGWIDLVSVSEKKISNIVENAATYNGVIEDFHGDYIIINTKDGRVDIPIKNVDGSYVKNGDIVIGSDNKEYKISNFNVEEVKNIMEESVEVVNGKKITFNVKDMNVLAGLPVLLAALEHIRKRKLNKDAANNPYYENMTIQEVEGYVDDFRKNKSDNKNILSYHVGSLFNDDDIVKIVKNAYENKTGILIDDMSDLYIDIWESHIVVCSKKHEDIGFVEVTDVVTKYLKSEKDIEKSFGIGYDPIAENYFQSEERGRGGR